MTTEQIARPDEATPEPRRRRQARAQDAETQAPPEPEEIVALTGENVPAHIGRIEWVLYGALTFIGALMRLWDLGSRAAHHDESLHATYSWYLWQRITGASPSAEYHYDPMMHGPYQFHGNAFFFLLFGPNLAAARMNAAICGTALIILPILLRRQLGRTGAILLSAMLAFSPAFLYYSRFTREDIYFALWTALTFVGLIRWLDARGRRNGHRWLYVAAAGLALSWATKESTYFTIIIIGGLLIGVFAIGYLHQFLRPTPTGKRGEVRETGLAAVLGGAARSSLPPLVATFRGTPVRAWLTALGIAAVISYVLFLPIGDPWQWGFIPGAHTQATQNAASQNVNYNTDFLTGGLSYWKLQQDVMRGGQPWYYYFLVIPLYEQVAVVFGAAGLVYYFLFSQRRTRLAVGSAVAFAALILLTLFAGPSLPHLLNLALVGLTVLAGIMLLVAQPRPLLINLLLWWTVVTWSLYVYAGEKMPWLTLHLLLPLYVVAALFAGRLLTAPRLSRRWIITIALLAVTGLISFRSSVALAYVDGANPTEMLVYTQTSPDVPMVSDMVHRIPPQLSTQGAKVRVWVDGADSWPWVWYLHDDPTNHGWQGSDTDTANASAGVIGAAQQRYPVVMVGSEDHTYMMDHDKLAAFTSYTPYEFKLRWWFPEDGYKAWEQTGLGGFLGQALQPSSWGSIVNWWATRTPFDQKAFRQWDNTYRFFVYVRSDLVKQYVPTGWAAAHAKALADTTYTPPAELEDVAGSLAHAVQPLLSVNGATLPRPMAVVRAVAVDAAGNIYLTDSASARVTKLDRTGRYLTSWGSPGSGPGQFSTQYTGSAIMGIAVGPNGHIYVSDTWNGRVQEFTAAGQFVRAFGHPNPTLGQPPTADSFYGPRQLAIAPNGNIYVADTGNERIQVYSPRGAHLFNFGAGSHSPETALGRFYEPSGIAIDKSGIVYVADYWDKRIQRFKLDGTPLGAFPIKGWAASDYGEPYLAVDSAGHLFATDAPASINQHVNHILMLDARTGAVLRAFGASGSGAGTLTGPSGIAIGPDGALYISDATAVKLLKVMP